MENSLQPRIFIKIWVLSVQSNIMIFFVHCLLLLKVAWIKICGSLYLFEIKIIKCIEVIYGIYFRTNIFFLKRCLLPNSVVLTFFVHYLLVFKVAWVKIYGSQYSFKVKILKTIKVIYGI
jgi:hypothetical protein